MRAVSQADPDTEQWLRALRSTGSQRTNAERALYELLVRAARGDAYRRGGHFSVTGPELDDLADQAAADAFVAVTTKLDEFRGESRFTTWAFKFAIFEVSSKLSRHFWRRSEIRLDAESWELLPARFGLDPEHESEWRDLIDALHRAVDTALTERQRTVFVAIVLNAVPIDELAAELSTNRNAIYKVLFDGRRALRAALVAGGHLDAPIGRSS
ncbi:MAG: RNA polymerase sigma factor [Jatrophihabitantaceae bacterium]